MTSHPDPEVFLGIASFDSRAELLRGAITSLIDQVDRIGVYLNNYDGVPSFLEHPRIEVALSRDYGDLRDNGKFFFLNECGHRFYATADDDIFYPPDYIRRLRSTLADAGPNAAIGVHGAIYPSRIIGLLRPRRLFHYLDPLPHVMPLHIIGTGTLLFEQKEWELRFEDFGEPGMADVWFALAARKRSARLFAINRGKEWLVDVAVHGEPNPAMKGPTLFAEGRANDSMQIKLVTDADISHGGFEGLIEKLIESNKFSEEFSASHAVALNELRKEMGWLPISGEFAGQVGERISATRVGWNIPSFSDDDITAYSAAVTGVLAEDVTADVVTTTVDALDRLEAMIEIDRNAWRSLPHPLRFDTRRDRLDRLRGLLFDLGVRRSQADARELWPRLALLEDAVPLDLAIEAERAGVDTRFQRLPKLRAAGAVNPVETGLLLREYFEARNWSVTPEVLAWKRAFGRSFRLKEVQLLLTLTALRTRNPAMAARLVEGMRHRWPGDFDVGLMHSAMRSDSAANVYEATLPVLEALDVLLELVDLRPYRDFARHGDRTMTHWIDVFDATSGGSPASTSADVREVSVIMTVHNNANTVEAAISSVLASQGAAVEMIVVDDASTDGTSAILAELADSRVKLVRNGENLGPYLSRNRGLELATGEFITIADADDWSHPDRMAYQAARLTTENDLLGCTVAHVRLRPDGNPDLENNLLFLGHGPVSLMFRRSVIDQVGGFDHVRTRGDLEFIRRLRARFGDGALTSFDVPLILATSNPASNSKRYTTEALGRYRRAARLWHVENAVSDALYVGLRGERAPFTAPQQMIAPGQIETTSSSR